MINQYEVQGKVGNATEDMENPANYDNRYDVTILVNVPGIADKLYPPQERKLEKVKKYWKLLPELKPIHEIYGHVRLSENDISIDHFVSWSYVAPDEFRNLHPTTRRINSSKNNNLPDWNIYFPQLAKPGFISYEMMWKFQIRSRIVL